MSGDFSLPESEDIEVTGDSSGGSRLDSVSTIGIKAGGTLAVSIGSASEVDATVRFVGLANSISTTAWRVAQASLSFKDGIR